MHSDHDGSGYPQTPSDMGLGAWCQSKTPEIQLRMEASDSTHQLATSENIEGVLNSGTVAELASLLSSWGE